MYIYIKVKLNSMVINNVKFGRKLGPFERQCLTTLSAVVVFINDLLGGISFFLKRGLIYILI